MCYPNSEGRTVWNATFKSFAEYWGFEPRRCRPYRAQTKGKVESGVKYIKHNFLPGRQFIDIVDLTEQLLDWNATIADVRVHGTTHERPIDRFNAEQCHLVPTADQRSFAHEGRRSRIVASDYLVSYQTNRYSVPFRLVGHTVQLQLRDGILFIHHRDRLIAEHPLLIGQHQLRILPEHGPGAIARNARQRFAPPDVTSLPPYHSEVQIRDLSVYDQLTAAAVAEVNHERRTA